MSGSGLARVSLPILAGILLGVAITGAVSTYLTFDMHSRSGNANSAYFLVKEEEAWSRQIGEKCVDHDSALLIVYCEQFPKVNFTSSTILAVFMGWKGNSGYNIKITGVSVAWTGILVATVRETEPRPGCITLQINTSPYDTMVIPKTDRHVEFQTARVVTKCDSDDEL